MEKNVHYLKLVITKEQENREVLSLLIHELGLSTRKIRSVKWDSRGILLDGSRAGVREKVRAGQRLSVLLNDTEQRKEKLAAISMELNILYEDENLLFVNKPAGVVCHPSKGHYADSLANGVQGYFKEKNERSGIHLVGRLDKDTSGIVSIAKNGVTAERMTALKKEGKLLKEYLAVISGCPHEKEGHIFIPMEEYRDKKDGEKLKMRTGKKERGKQAGTHYQVLETWSGNFSADRQNLAVVWADNESADKGREGTAFCGETGFPERSLCRVTLDTGRMHQIRFHMSAIGHPLLGDSLYGHLTKEDWNIPEKSQSTGQENENEQKPYTDELELWQRDGIYRAALHAHRLFFVHPFTGKEMILEAELPKDMKRLLGKM